MDDQVSSTEDKLREADKEISSFGSWFQEELGQGPFVRSERAVLRMYVLWKEHGPQWVAEARAKKRM